MFHAIGVLECHLTPFLLNVFQYLTDVTAPVCFERIRFDALQRGDVQVSSIMCLTYCGRLDKTRWGNVYL